MSAVEAEALHAVAGAVRDYAKCITLDIYGDRRQYESDFRAQEHFNGLADSLTEAAEIAKIADWQP